MDNTTSSAPVQFPELEQYLALLAERGATEGNLIRRRTFLTLLLKDLKKLPNTEKVYGALVEEKLRSFGQEELRHFFQVTAREFFWFWTNDVDKIEAYVSGREKISVNPFRIQVNESLDELQLLADAHDAAQPHPAIIAYAAHLTPGNEQAEIRLRYMRLLTFVIREFEQHPDMFRAGVTAVADKFSSVVTRESFLVVVREFYPFWIKALATNKG